MEKSHREFLLHEYEYSKLNEDEKRLVDKYTRKYQKPYTWVHLNLETQKIYEK
jgi:hypothetical protein